MSLQFTELWKKRHNQKPSSPSTLYAELDEDFDDVLFFEPENYVERLSSKALSSQGDTFNPTSLRIAFQGAIRHLQKTYKAKDKYSQFIEQRWKEKDSRHHEKLKALIEKNKDAFETFKQLDKRIDFVATKIVLLGEQLESVNTPRARAVEAQILMNSFAELHRPNFEIGGVLNDRNRLYEAADIIQKLHFIAQELPSGRPKFEKARERIAFKYNQIECQLIEEFVEAHKQSNIMKMKEVATILSNFRGYSECIDAFIEERQKVLSTSGDILTRIVPSCSNAQKIIKEVFKDPETVMAKYILNLFHEKVQQHIRTELDGNLDLELYLSRLERYYTRTKKVVQELTNLKFGCDVDTSFLHTLVQNIFSKDLNDYIHKEVYSLEMKCKKILKEYYDLKNHQRKQVHFSGIRRDIQAIIGATRSSLPDNYGGETFLSEDIVMAMLYESKNAFTRCELLFKHQSEVAGNALKLFDVIMHYIFEDHVFYAIELSLGAIPPAEPKNQPEIFFFDIIRQVNVIYHLFDRQFSDTIVPLVAATVKYTTCLQKKQKIMKEMEIKLTSGLERCITAITGWVKYLLGAYQKKTDFKPENEMWATIDADKSTAACSNVVKYVSECVQKIKPNLDGNNVQAVLTELGLRLHHVILDHLLQFQYSSFGAMVVICDLNEYRRCISKFEIPLVNVLFETLHALCNLLVIEPSNVRQTCDVGLLASLDRSVLMKFIQLRSDYKAAKLANLFK